MLIKFPESIKMVRIHNKKLWDIRHGKLSNTSQLYSHKNKVHVYQLMQPTLHILQLTIFRNLIWDFHVVSNNPSQTLIIKVYVVLFLFYYELTVSKANSILNLYQTGHLSTPYGHQNYWQQNIQSCLFITFSHHLVQQLTMSFMTTS